MDSKYLDGLSQRERIYIHRCRIYLQVETVSDIATSTGQTIHKAWRSPNTKKPSRSTLNWPRQNQPSRIAWLSWEKFLDTFTTTSGKLRKPLGQWTELHKFRLHEAYLTEDGHILWVTDQTQGKGFNGYAQKATQRKAIIFHGTAATSAEELPPFATPINILSQTEYEIRTTRRSGYRSENRTRQNLPWYKKSPQRLQHIIGDVDLIHNETNIREMITNNALFEAASDGGFDPTTGISSFGWTVAINKQLIARGRGAAQAHPKLAESFRAEGYGLTSVLLFIRNLMSQFNIRPREHSWKIYLDSKSLIQRMNSYHTWMPVPRWNLRPDEDIARTAHSLLAKLPIQLQHVKSHQDDKHGPSQINFEAQMNILADEEATRQRNTMCGPAEDVHNIAIAQLRIADMAITRDSQRWLLQAAGKPPIQQYYLERHGWTREVFDSISWETQRAVIRTYNHEDQTRILKFVHGWLPTQHRREKEGASSS